MDCHQSAASRQLRRHYWAGMDVHMRKRASTKVLSKPSLSMVERLKLTLGCGIQCDYWPCHTIALAAEGVDSVWSHGHEFFELAMTTPAASMPKGHLSAECSILLNESQVVSPNYRGRIAPCRAPMKHPTLRTAIVRPQCRSVKGRLLA